MKSKENNGNGKGSKMNEIKMKGINKIEETVDSFNGITRIYVEGVAPATFTRESAIFRAHKVGCGNWVVLNKMQLCGEQIRKAQSKLRRLGQKISKARNIELYGA